jgi:Zn finger protein HypA/HybF involved in hydrogenase expression
MHETVFIDKIVKEAQRHGEVEKIVVEVGELAEIAGEDLERELREAVKWKVKVLKKEGLVECGCGFKGRPKIIEKSHDFTLFECPRCGDIPTVLDGNKVILKDIVVK